MFEIMTVCTGNICRSPLAEVLLRTRLADLDVNVTSAGTQGLDGWSMTDEAQQLAVELGVDAADAAAHEARFLNEGMLQQPDLILALTREHRSHILGLAPARTRRTFTAREFGRLAASLSDDELREAAALGGSDQVGRMRSAIAAVADQRGFVPAPADGGEDDVVDPYRRSWNTYQRSAAEMMPGIDQVERVLRIAAEQNG